MTNHTIRVRKTKPIKTIAKTEKRTALKEFILFISIPTVLILIVAAIVQGPSLFAHPTYDFIYSMCNDYGCSGSYTITPGDNISYSQGSNTDGNTTKQTLYYYSEETRSSRQIPLNQASGYTLDTSNVSPDGYVLRQDTGSDNSLFAGGGSYNWYLINGTKRKQVNLVDNGYGANPQFIGWVR